MNHSKKIEKSPFVILLGLILGGGSILRPDPYTYNIFISIFNLYALIINWKYKSKFTKSEINVFFLFLFVLVLFYFFGIGEQLINQYVKFFATLTYVVLSFKIFRSANIDVIFYLQKALYYLAVYGLLSGIAFFFVEPFLQGVFIGKYPIDTFYYIFYYKSLYYNIQSHFDFILPLRFQSIFWEPGIFQFYLNLLLFISLFIKPNVKYVVLSVLLIFATASTTGMLILSIQFLFFVFGKKLKKKYIIFKPITLFIFIIIAFFAYNNLVNKLYGVHQGSAYARQTDSVIALLFIYKNPFGYGLDYKELYSLLQTGMIYLDKYRPEISLTNSVFSTALKFGVPFTILLLVALYYQPYVKKHRSLFFLIFILTGLAEPIFLFSFNLFFIVSGMINLQRKLGVH